MATKSKKSKKKGKKSKTKDVSTAMAAPASPARSGDLIVLDSEKVGSPAREGEVLEVVASDVRVSYRVRWDDGHQSLISPAAGSVRVVHQSA